MHHNGNTLPDIRQFRFLVTGGAGFIGSNIVKYLLNQGAQKVRALDNLSTGSFTNLEPFANEPAFEFVQGDITNTNDCLLACSGIDYVLHQAALGSVPRSIKDPLATNHANVSGFLNVLQGAKAGNVRRLVYASSSSVYGDSPVLPKREENVGTPLSPYAVSKRVNELYAQVFSKTYDMEILGLRYFNVFGPNQSPDGPYAAVIPLFISAVLGNKSPVIHGDGNQSRDFTFVANVVDANIRALFCPATYCDGSAINVACGEKTSINELFYIIQKIDNSTVLPEYNQTRPGDVKHSQADIAKAKKILDYKPSVDIVNGLKLTFDWFKNQTLRPK